MAASTDAALDLYMSEHYSQGPSYFRGGPRVQETWRGMTSCHRGTLDRLMAMAIAAIQWPTSTQTRAERLSRPYCSNETSLAEHKSS